MLNKQYSLVVTIIATFIFVKAGFISSDDSASNQHKDKQKVIIVGAGLAGLGAAAHLLSNNVSDILILEASDRVGGRVYTAEFGDYLIEYGAQWIHGQTNNTVFELVKPYNVTLLQDLEYNIHFFKHPDSKVNMSVVDQLYLDAINIFENENELADCNCSLSDYFIPRFQKLVKESDIDSYTAQALQDIVLHFEGSYHGTGNLSQVGSLGYNKYHELDGSHSVAWKSGYHELIDILLGKYDDKPLPVIENVQFNKVVQNITWNENGVELICEDGSRYLTDHAIITVSLGVLKHSANEMFSPQLPERKLSAITSLGFDLVNKIFIQFSTHWWPMEFDFDVTLLWSDEDREKFHKESKHGGWASEIMIFHSVVQQPRVLEGWAVGEAARKLEHLSEEEITDAVMEVLHYTLDDKYNISEPINATKSSWLSNRFVRGSYSYRTVHSDYHGYDANDIAEPVLNEKGIPILLFAGEATHDNFYSTVHGALETGRREATRILNL